MLAFIGTGANATSITAPAGWTAEAQLIRNASGVTSIACFSKISDGVESEVIFTIAGAATILPSTSVLLAYDMTGVTLGAKDSQASTTSADPSLAMWSAAKQIRVFAATATAATTCTYNGNSAGLLDIAWLNNTMSGGAKQSIGAAGDVVGTSAAGLAASGTDTINFTMSGSVMIPSGITFVARLDSPTQDSVGILIG